MNLEELYKDLNNWQNKTFPQSDEVSKLKHLREEALELIEELEKPERDYEAIIKEYADCFLLLFGSAGKINFSVEDILGLMQNKLRINKERNWGKPDEHNVYRHIKE